MDPSNSGGAEGVPSIDIRELNRWFDGFVAVDRVTITIRQGEMVLADRGDHQAPVLRGAAYRAD